MGEEDEPDLEVVNGPNVRGVMENMNLKEIQKSG